VGDGSGRWCGEVPSGYLALNEDDRGRARPAAADGEGARCQDGRYVLMVALDGGPRCHQGPVTRGPDGRQARERCPMGSGFGTSRVREKGGGASAGPCGPAATATTGRMRRRWAITQTASCFGARRREAPSRIGVAGCGGDDGGQVGRIPIPSFSTVNSCYGTTAMGGHRERLLKDPKHSRRKKPHT